MLERLKYKVAAYFSGNKEENQNNQSRETPFKTGVTENIEKMKEMCGNTADLVVRQVGVCGRLCAVIHMEGMISKYDLAMTVVDPLTHAVIESERSPKEAFDYLRDNVFYAVDQMQAETLEQCILLIMSGFAAFIIDGAPHAVIIGVHGFQYRSISEPSSETTQYGSREGFSEVLRINMAMVRRRIKSTRLVFEFLNVGRESQTNICLCYMKNMAEEKSVDKIRKKLKSIQISDVFAAEYIRPFLEDKPLALFDTVGITERPDVLCGKIAEGRVGILVDGVPNALISPYLFTENFQTADDYSEKPLYAAFSRWLRYISFLVSLYLPALYVAIGVMHNELLPAQLLMRLIEEERGTPFSITAEIFILHVVFELIREAGLRMPRPISNSVSFIATLLIGEAAVNAGLISLPSVMLVAITGICSFTAPALYQAVAILRLVFIIVAGWSGIIGIAVLSAVLLVNICAHNSNGVPFSAPVSPFRLKSMRDIAMRLNWRILGSKTVKIDKMPGSNYLDDK